VEAVVDIDCDLPPGFDLPSLEQPAREAYRDRYPTLRKQYVQEHQIEARPDAPPLMSVGRSGIQALQLLAADGKQLVQVRAQGFSFNRLAPYSSLDDYLADIESGWRAFVVLAAPVQVTTVRLRYINRLLLPLVEGEVNLDEYLKSAPRASPGAGLKLGAFLNQHVAVETATGHQVTVVLAAQPPEAGFLPVIFDNAAASLERREATDWSGILGTIHALRILKNRVFQETLTDRCLSLFRQP